MTYLDKYPNCNGCPVEKYCGTVVSSIRLCNSCKEPNTSKSFLAVSSNEIGNMSVACRKVKEGATCNNYFFSYEPLTIEQLRKAAEIKQFYIQHKNRHPGYNDIKTL